MRSLKPSEARRLLVALTTLLILVGCGGDDGPSEPTDGGANATVGVQNNLFSPSTVTVAVNGTVAWLWNSGGVAHNVTFADGSTSGDRTSGSFERIFSTVGAFNYQCTIHPGMTGSVNVTASGGGGGGGGGGDDDGGYP
jgi:plastocyanin